MPRKRMIDPNFWRDEKIASCSFVERLLFIGLWTFAEDSGVGRASPLLIKADVFPYETLREADIKKGLDKLASLGLIRLYTVETQSYYYVVNFKKHQTINRPSICCLPLPPNVSDEFVLPYEGDEDDSECENTPVAEDCGSTAVVLTEDSRSTHGALTSQVKLSKEKISKENTYVEIVSLLNENAGTCYRASSAKTQRLIDARIGEGFVHADFRRVIETKCADWNVEPLPGGKDMRPYLRPETLFGTKFESYLNQGGHPAQTHAPDEQLPPPAWVSKENPSIEDILEVSFE